jgi:hypothetical protein
MLNDWFYSHQTWQVALFVCSLVLIVPLIGLYIFHRSIDWHKREKDTSMVGLSYSLCGGIYAVVLAFVGVGTYQTMEKSTATASDEANSLGSLIFNSAGLPKELAKVVRQDIVKYIDIVIQYEWCYQRAYQMDEKNFEPGWSQLRKISADVSGFEPETSGQATVKTQMLRTSNELFNSRLGRLLAANAHLADPIWEMLIFGLLLVAVFLYLMGPHSYKVHMAVTSLTMLSIGLIFTLIIALDYPFRGDLSVGDEAFLGVKEAAAITFATQDSGHPTATRLP